MKHDLVIFDVDGTLHDTFQWWAPCIRKGVAVLGEKLGRTFDVPTTERANDVVGMKDEGVWGPFLPDDLKHRWAELRDVVVPIEVDELRSGRDYLYPGIRELMTGLREAGVHVALASNCRQDYFSAVCEGQGLGPLSDRQFCLDSPGVETKTDMVRLAVEAFGARTPVMVGDREPDLEAARAVGMPFWWRQNDRCDLTEVAEGVWSGDPDELLGAFDVRRIS